MTSHQLSEKSPKRQRNKNNKIRNVYDKYDLSCICGKSIGMYENHYRNVDPCFDLFCSLKCLFNYIEGFKGKKQELLIEPPHVNLDTSIYDRFTKIFYRSMYEVYLARFFKENKIAFKYEPHSFFVGIGYYTPDFYLPEHNLYVECKGKWHEKGKAKVKAVQDKISIIVLQSYLQYKLSKYKDRLDKIV